MVRTHLPAILHSNWSCFNELGQIPQQVSEDLTRSCPRDNDFCNSFHERLGRLILPQRGWKFSNDLGG